jgi:hypothetical protein
MVGYTRNAYTILMGRPVGKLPYGSPGSWEDNIKVDLGEAGFKAGWKVDIAGLESCPVAVWY